MAPKAKPEGEPAGVFDFTPTPTFITLSTKYYNKRLLDYFNCGVASGKSQMLQILQQKIEKRSKIKLELQRLKKKKAVMKHKKGKK